MAAQAYAVSARYFLSLTGLADANDEQSAANAPTSVVNDPVLDTGGSSTTIRLYLWADLSPLAVAPATDVTMIDLAISTSGNLVVERTNIWQRILDDGATPDDSTDDLKRWAYAPGIQTWNSNVADMAPAVAVLQPGLTTRNFIRALDNQDRAGGLWLFGWVEVNGTVGDILIHNNATSFLQRATPTNTVHLGLDDSAGGPAAVPGQSVSYSNASPEAFVGPEPSALALMTLAALAIGRR
ncbi:MAG: hypothetical protein SF069_18380 [Phycisphaerae bacterium]|nr:hypothetical protein [Phycisphaerae bacterium]